MGFTYVKIALNRPEKYDVCISIVVMKGADTG